MSYCTWRLWERKAKLRTIRSCIIFHQVLMLCGLCCLVWGFLWWPWPAWLYFARSRLREATYPWKAALDTSAPELLGFFSKSESVLGFETQWEKWMPDSRVSLRGLFPWHPERFMPVGSKAHDASCQRWCHISEWLSIQTLCQICHLLAL